MRYRGAATLFLLALTAAMSPSAQAQRIVIDLPPPSIYLAVGSMGATIDTVTFPLGAQPLGTAIPQLEAAVLFEVAFYRGGGGGGSPNRAVVTMTPSPLTGLTDGIVSVPWTEFSWISTPDPASTANSVIPSGAFTGAADQQLFSFTAPANQMRWAGASLLYQYANSAAVPSGTYAGRVTFTAITP